MCIRDRADTIVVTDSGIEIKKIYIEATITNELPGDFPFTPVSYTHLTLPTSDLV